MKIILFCLLFLISIEAHSLQGEFDSSAQDVFDRYHVYCKVLSFQDQTHDTAETVISNYASCMSQVYSILSDTMRFYHEETYQEG